MQKIKSSAFLAFFLTIAVIFSLTAFAKAVEVQDQGQNQEVNQQQNQEQNQGEDIMNQEQNQGQEQEQNEEGEACQNKCGDGACQEVVCMAIDCPCSENKENCPEDCPNNTASDNGASVVGQGNKNQVGQVNAKEHRSAVANFVQALLRVASSTEKATGAGQKKIGEQVRVIAQQQNESANTTIRAMERVQTRSRIKTFFIGADYKNLGALRSEMVQTKNRIEQLNGTMVSIQNASDTAEIQAQIQTLEQEQTKIENFIKQNESKFSLFGWFVKLFNR
ncbi:MAG: hypothetical protein ABH813_00340 [Patescibacteria group bacterium]